jgi:hypothetical protein
MKTNWKNGNYFIVSNRASDLIVDYSEKTGNKTVLPVYFTLCYYANPSRTCFPGYSRLKHVSVIGSSSISNALKILEKLGIITIKKVAGKVSFYQPTRNQPVQPLDNTCPIVGHEEWSLKNDQRRTFTKKRMGVGKIKKWVETIAPITEEFKGSSIVPLERRILEHLFHRFSGEDVLVILESERGRKGLEFGIIHPEAKDTDLWTQA